jgi:hypothetical protein
MHFFYCYIRRVTGSTFFFGKLDIYDALAAYYKVVRFSSKCLSDGARHATIRVYELPPRDCFSSYVSLDSR